MKYIAYCRKSTDEKDRQVLSIDAQIAELQEFAKRERLEVVDFIVEAKTAKEPGREQFAQVLQRIESGEAQGILSWHPDRLARNSVDGGRVIYLLDTGKLLDLKFPSFWFQNTPQGKFMLGMAFNQSKYYVDSLSENVKRGIRQKLRQGIWPKQAPLGYKNNPKTKGIDMDPEVVPIVKKAFALFAEGNRSFTEIADFFFKHGITGKTGKRLHLTETKRLLGKTFYIGYFKFNGELYQGSHKCFISKSTFQKVQERLKKIERPRNRGHNFPFVGLARCSECGGAITAESHPRFYPRTGRKVDFVYYRCTKKFGSCFQRYTPAADFEVQLKDLLFSASLPNSWQKNWNQWLLRDEKLEKESAEKNLAGYQVRIVDLDKKQNLLLDTFLEGIIDEEIFKTKKNEMFEKKQKLEEELLEVKAMVQVGSNQ